MHLLRLLLRGVVVRGAWTGRPAVVFQEKYSAAWLSTMDGLLRTAEALGDPASLMTNLEGGTQGFTSQIRRCPAVAGWTQHTCPRTRDVLDFVSIHLGSLHRLGNASRLDLGALEDLERFFAARARREERRTRRFDVDASKSRDESLALVPVCHDCARPRQRSRNVRGRSDALELAYVRATVQSLRATCRVVVAGVVEAMAPSETEWARRAGREAASRLPSFPPFRSSPGMSWRS